MVWGHGASIPGPQKRGTGGTLSVVWNDYRDRRHPPKIRLIMGRFYNSVNKRNVEAWAALAFELFDVEQLWPWSQH
jgi:hypothetical protein